MDQASKNKAIIQRFYDECLNRRNASLVDVLVAPHVSITAQSNPAVSLSGAGFKNALAKQWSDSPDHQYRILDMVAYGDDVIVRLSATYQHRLPLANFPPTGRMITGKEICYYRLQGGLITHVCTLVDEFGIIQQVMPTPGQVARW